MTKKPKKAEKPDWFKNLINIESKELDINIDGVNISFRTWGNADKKPGLLFVHGYAAHSHWWDFIAPEFCEDYKVGAIDLSGSGNSDHRLEYSALGFASEILTVAAELSEETIIVGHSFGGTMTRIAAFEAARLDKAQSKEKKAKIKAIVLVDSVIPENRATNHPKLTLKPQKPTRYYKDLETGMLRFRLKPPQKCENQFLLDHIASHSLKATASGYCFKLDQQVFAKMTAETTLPSGAAMLKEISCPVGFIYGGQSRFFPQENRLRLEDQIGRDLLFEIPEARHHVFLDEPQEFTEALKRLLTALS